MEESCSASLTNESDIYQEVLELYGVGEAPTHDDQLLCSATKAIHTHFRETKSPTSSPLDYLNRIVHTFTTTDRDLDVQLPLLSFVLPRIPDHSSIDKDVAAKAAEMVVRGLQGRVHSVMALRLFECLKMLLERCEFENWNQAQPGFQTFIKYSTDSRINVRTCAQEYVVKVFKSFQSLPLKVGAGKSVLESLTSTAADGVSKNLEFHMLDVFKSLIPCLPSEVIAEAIVKLQNSMSDSKLSSRMKRRVMKVMEAILGFIESLCERTFRKKVVIAKEWEGGYSSVIGIIAGLLTAEEAIAARASYILREKIHIVSMFEYRGQTEVESRTDPEGLKMLNSLCHVFDKILLNEPNAHSLLVITTLFLKLGSCSKKYLDNILLKLATFITTASGDAKQHLERCIGIAICSMGSEAVLKLIPISLDDYDQSSKNTWLIPLLKDYTINSSLESFIVTILPLAESFRQACGKVKKRPTLREEMECNARGCWGLLPSFCRYPQDMSKMFDSLANLLFPYINGENEAQYILENIAIALQYLVKQNKKISFLVDDEASKLPCSDYYRKREAPKNIEALSLWSERFLEAFVKVFLQASPRMRNFLMETIRCLALITESSAVELIFISSFKLDEPGDNIERNRNLMLELASSFAKPTSTDLIYSFIKKYLQEECYSKKEAYATVLSILEDSHELLSSKFAQLVDLLLDLKPHVNKTSYGWWISCLRTLLLQSFKITFDGENKYATRVLNEIIDLKERSTLVKISSTLRETSSSSNTGSYSDFIIMVMQGLCESLSVLMSIDPKVCYLRPGLVPTVLALLHTQRDSQVIEATRVYECVGFVP